MYFLKCQIFFIEYKYIFIECKNAFLLQISNHTWLAAAPGQNHTLSLYEIKHTLFFCLL